MSSRVVTSQAEFDAALTDDMIDTIHIDAPKTVELRIDSNNGKWVTVRGSSTVGAVYGEATVGAVYGEATVGAVSGQATVGAVYGEATVGEVYGRATVDAVSGQATVREVYGQATVRAVYGESAIRVYQHAKIENAAKYATIYLHSTTATVNGGHIIDLTQLDLTVPASWADYQDVQVTDGKARLYKALPGDLTTGPNHGKPPVVWTPGSTVEASDWVDNNSCGGGLHLSPTPTQAKYYRREAARYVEVEADLSEIRPIIDDPGGPKCKVRRARVVREVDQWRDPVATESRKEEL